MLSLMCAMTMKPELASLKGQLIHVPQLSESSHYGWMMNSNFLRQMPKLNAKVLLMNLENQMWRGGNLHLELQCIVLVEFGVKKPQVFSSAKGLKRSTIYKAGILKYLEEVPKTESLWEGECFVFDKRVSVKHGLVPGNFKLCYGCKKPVSDADMESPEWEYGVTCPYCYTTKSEEEKERARARQRQFEEWGVIGGPDKGRRPAKTTNTNENGDAQMSRSL